MVKSKKKAYWKVISIDSGLIGKRLIIQSLLLCQMEIQILVLKAKREAIM